MNKTTTLSVEPTVGLTCLLGNTGLCKSIYRAKREFDDLFNQILMDHVSEANVADAGATVLAMKKIKDTFMLFASKGQELVSQENRADSKSK